VEIYKLAYEIIEQYFSEDVSTPLIFDCMDCCDFGPDISFKVKLMLCDKTVVKADVGCGMSGILLGSITKSTSVTSKLEFCVVW
jgi:hypothetical protein